MAKPVAAFVQLPSDAGNVGKETRTQTRVVSGQTVHEHFMVPISQRSIEGVYHGDPGAVNTVQASAQNGTSTGFFWLANVSGNTVTLGVRRVKIEHNIVGTTVFVTLPRIALALFTFTGTPSGAAVAVAKRASADASAQGTMRTAATGMTVTLGAILNSTIPASVTTTASGALNSTATDLLGNFHPMTDQDGNIAIATGEGMVLYQPDAGTASDARKFDADLVWEEYDNT